MLRSIAAVLAGYISIGVLVVLTDVVVAGLSPGHYTAGTVPPAYYFVVSIFTAPLYSVFGGWLCGRLAATNPWNHGLALAAFGELIGLASTVAMWNRQPHWYALALLVFYPPAVMWGARLSERSRIMRLASAR